MTNDPDKQREWARQHYLRPGNKEKIMARNAAWREANRERYNARKRQWRINRLDKDNAQGRARYAKNRDHILAIGRASDARTSVARKAYAKQYRKDNAVKLLADYQLRRAKTKAATIDNPAAIHRWQVAWRKQESVTCYWCNDSFIGRRGHMDHVIALKLGGAHSLDNLCIACRSCNLKKNSKSVRVWVEELEAA